MEELFIYAVLFQNGLAEREDYLKKMDDLFLKDETNDCLLELEFCSRDSKKSLSILMNYWLYTPMPLQGELFGRPLVTGLKNVYRQRKMDLDEFGKRAFGVWQMLPHQISMKEPFWTLSYADDCLSWGDRARARELYEGIFDFYN